MDWPTNNKRIVTVLSCRDLVASIDFFVERAGFRLESIFPADNPRTALLSCNDFLLRLDRSRNSTNAESQQITLHVPELVSESIVSPEGVVVRRLAESDFLIPPPEQSSISVTRNGTDADWMEGRAGMKYRDLIPSRLGGFVIASHILVPGSGPVPDYVHFHQIGFQIIFCLRGSAKLVYEDQGAPFAFEAGDCVLQPPGIRHRVLESADDLEVMEVSSPAEHKTFVEHSLKLPNDKVDHGRRFENQQFCLSSTNEAKWNNGIRVTEIGKASDGIGSVRVFRTHTDPHSIEVADNSILVLFVKSGRGAIVRDNQESIELGENDTAVIPAGEELLLDNMSTDFELIETCLRIKND